MDVIIHDEAQAAREMVRITESDPTVWLKLWVEKLLSYQNEQGLWGLMCNDFFYKCCEFIGVDERYPDSSILKDTILPSGKALSVFTAALCTKQGTRTTRFIRGIHQAIEDLKKRFPGEKLRILYAGTGPLAPLAFPVLALHGCENICYDCLDIHSESLNCAENLAKHFGVEKGINQWICADAATYQLPDTHPGYHLIITEVLQEALKNEPQVAVTINLSQLLIKGGVFIPENIQLSLKHYDQNSHIKAMLKREADISKTTELIANIFELSVDRAREWGACGNRIPGVKVQIPHRDQTRWKLHVFTEIQIYKSNKLTAFESSLNLPFGVEKLIQGKTEAEFYYEISETPGLRVVK